MNSYDFRSLNDKEFETFAMDLLAEEYGVRVERFKSGKDAGVDGRWFASIGSEVVIQCKHWIGTGYKGLLRHLKDENHKLDLIKPARYILVTSVPLSRSNKKEIAAVFSPYIRSESDVLGPEDLNDLLGRHHSVESRHYKLWLASSNTLGLLLNNAIIGRSRAELTMMYEEAILYVLTADHLKAWQHLDKHRILILAGDPGIGKTTLARQLILEHVTQGFSLAVLEESVSEAEAIFVEGEKQIFYFDDFLGRSFLEALKTKQDSHITNFMKRIARDPAKRFVLTSRTNILNQGAVLSDLLGQSSVAKNTYVLEIGNLTTMDRARILYSHVWHSTLTTAYIDELYVEKRYHGIIKHQNFNPRLVAFILDSDKVASVSVPDYWRYVSHTLDNPQEIWSHFFAAQLSQDCRDLVYLTVLNGKSIREEELRESFSSLPAKATGNVGLTVHEFNNAIRLASGSVLNRTLYQGAHTIVYSLFNPSIADYVLRYLGSSNLWEYYYPHVRTMASLWQLEQMRPEPFFGEAAYRRVLYVIARTEMTRTALRDNYSLRVARLIASVDELRKEFADIVYSWITSPVGEVVGSQVEDYVRVILAWRDIVEPEVFIEHMVRLPDHLERGHLPLDEPALLAALLAELQELELSDAYDSVRAQIITEWGEQVEDQIKEENLLAHYLDINNTGRARRELEDVVEKNLSDAGVALTRNELTDICDLVDMDDVIERNVRTANAENAVVKTSNPPVNTHTNDTSAIDDLFDRGGR